MDINYIEGKAYFIRMGGNLTAIAVEDELGRISLITVKTTGKIAQFPNANAMLNSRRVKAELGEVKEVIF